MQEGKSLVGLGVLVCLGCTTPVAAELDEHAANEVVTALEAGGIAAEKAIDPATEGRWRIEVPRADRAEASRILAEENLPAPQAPGVLEALGDGALIPSRAHEQAKLLAGTAAELERTLRSVDGVLSARVHLAVPPPSRLGDGERPPSTASVLVRHRGASPALSQRAVQELVAGAVPALKPESVSVVLNASPKTARTHEPLARLGPVTVTRSSLPRLQLFVLAIAVLNIALVGLLLALWARVRRLRALEASSSKPREATH